MLRALLICGFSACPQAGYSLTPEQLADCFLLEREIKNLEQTQHSLDQTRLAAMRDAMEARLQRRTLADTARVDPVAAIAVADLDRLIASAQADAEASAETLQDVKARRQVKGQAYNATCAGLVYDEQTYRRALRVLRRTLEGPG
ncbi:MAG: hypothetical protein AAGA78_06305 [Pseudomonadota bacterium]